MRDNVVIIKVRDADGVVWSLGLLVGTSATRTDEKGEVVSRPFTELIGPGNPLHVTEVRFVLPS